jgi:hypothetical protein
MGTKHEQITNNITKSSLETDSEYKLLTKTHTTHHHPNPIFHRYCHHLIVQYGTWQNKIKQTSTKKWETKLTENKERLRRDVYECNCVLWFPLRSRFVCLSFFFEWVNLKCKCEQKQPQNYQIPKSNLPERTRIIRNLMVTYIHFYCDYGDVIHIVVKVPLYPKTSCLVVVVVIAIWW